MLERRSEARALVDEAGIINIDEHTTIPCVVYDLSESGVRLTMLSTALVPDAFILDAPCVVSGVCQVVWRTDESLGVSLRPLS